MKTFSCCLCKEFFLTHEESQKHVEQAHNCICRTCGEHFTRQKKLRQHRLEVHKDEDELKCSTCGKHCATINSLAKHSARHGKTVDDKIYPCSQCDKTFTTQSTLYHHKKGIHGVEKPFSCDKCGKSFNFSNSLKLHVLKHSGDRPFACKECDKTYLTGNHLKNHVMAVHRQVRKFSCKMCSKTFPYENSLRMHMMLHTGVRPFLCSKCDRTFVSKSALKVHEANHMAIKNLPCIVCHKTFKTEQLLRAHSRRHTGEGSRFMCDLCGHTFMYKSNLEAHKLVHGEGRKFVCAICGKAFKTQATLYTHNAVHRTETPWKCPQCGKAFKTKDRMIAHEKRHSGLKPFNCDQCGRCFPDKGGLTKHMRTVHTDFKRYICQLCGKSCTRSDNLRVHMKTHGEENLDKITKLPAPESPTQMTPAVATLEMSETPGLPESNQIGSTTLTPVAVGIIGATSGNNMNGTPIPIITGANTTLQQMAPIPPGALNMAAALNMTTGTVSNSMTPVPHIHVQQAIPQQQMQQTHQQIPSGHSTPVSYTEGQNIPPRQNHDQEYLQAANNLLIMQYHQSGFQYGGFGGQY